MVTIKNIESYIAPNRSINSNYFLILIMPPMKHCYNVTN